MEIAITLPDDVGHRLQLQWRDIPLRALEALAIEAYRSGTLTEAEVQKLLNLPSRWDVDAFLKSHQAYSEYTEADLEADIAAIRESLPS